MEPESELTLRHRFMVLMSATIFYMGFGPTHFSQMLENFSYIRPMVINMIGDQLGGCVCRNQAVSFVSMIDREGRSLVKCGSFQVEKKGHQPSLL